MIAFVIGALLRKSAANDIWLAVKQAFGQISKVCVSLILMLVIARTMVHGQMINTLAEFAATSTGSAWPIFSPFIGVLGSFVTGSATASNILFSEFQANIAQTIGVSVPLILGVQAFGAAIGNIVCPHNIIAGCATVNLHGKEGEILRKTMLCCVIYSLAGGVLALLFSFLI